MTTPGSGPVGELDFPGIACRFTALSAAPSAADPTPYRRARGLRRALVGLTVLTATLAGAQPADLDRGVVDVLELYSPAFLAGGPHVTSYALPAAHVLNPALPAAAERANFDLSYVALVQLTEQSELLGNVISGGVTLPTDFGVWSVSGHYTVISPDHEFSEDNKLGTGRWGALNVSFAKELFPDLYLGAGIGGQFGQYYDVDMAWGLGLDLGLFHQLGDVGPFHDLSWGVALRGIGKEFKPLNDAASQGDGAPLAPLAPAPFTPAVGVAFSPLRTDTASLAASVDLWAPEVQSLRISAGLDLAIREFLLVRAQLPIAVGKVAKGRTPVAFGLSFSFNFALPGDTQVLGLGDRGWAEGEVNVHTAMAPLTGDGVWGLGVGAGVALGVLDTEPPVVAIDSAEVEHRSPNLDGVQDDLVLPIRITDEGLVAGYRLTIEDADGVVVREIRNQDWRPESGGLQQALGRLLETRSAINIPETLRWDGRAATAQVVPDGTYYYSLEAWDDRGNYAVSPRRAVVIDITPPVVEVQVPYLMFSPNGDGNKDTLPVQQRLSAGDRWQAEVVSAAGERVARFNWDVDPPTEFAWDGRTGDDTPAADGVYSYRLVGRDLAGNTTEWQIKNIIINTEATPIWVGVTDNLISPNRDGVEDVVSYEFRVPVTSNIESWTLVVYHEDGEVTRSYAGHTTVPREVIFDGRNDAGDVVAEGSYTARLQIVYANGNEPEAAAPPVAVDLTAPTATIKADLAVFSPDGDGKKDTVTVFQETSDEALWTGTITTPQGQVVRSETWRGVAPDNFTWDGRRDDGLPAVDGIYRYTLAARDFAGNTALSNTVVVELDTADTPVALATDSAHFSPNADGVAELLTMLLGLEDTDGIDRYAVTVYAGSDHARPGRAVRSFSGRTTVPAQLAWDGLDEAGDRVEDGPYFVELDVLYAKGNNPVARSTVFWIDTRYPEAELTFEYLLFSPDGDGRRDTLPVAQSSTSEELWQGEISASDGTVVRRYFWRGVLQDFAWDGNDEQGNAVPDGTYSYVITGSDLAGNTATAPQEGIAVDARPTSLFVTLESDGFSPNGDRIRDQQGVGLVVGLNAGISSWTVQFVHEQAGTQRTIQGAGGVPERLIWDGRTDRNSVAPDGVYHAQVALNYLKGNQPHEQTGTFLLDTSPPQITLALSPQPFSPDNDGVNDELTLSIAVDDLSPIAGWNITIIDPVGEPFTTFAGRGLPSRSIIWDGLSASGELVESAYDYAVALAVSDAVGNVAAVDALIPVDVLVIRDGDKLRISVASINFPPNSADLSRMTGAAAARNGRTLARLGEIFAKYGQYTIRIEGHANSVHYADQAAAEREHREELIPLSTARAEAVQQALMALGVDEERISTVGLGGSNPIVPFSDLKNRWKNRRVEFILTGRGS